MGDTSLYQVGFTLSGVATNLPLVQIRNISASYAIGLKSVQVINRTASVTQLSVARATAQGTVNAAGDKTPQATDGSGATLATAIATAWTVNPTKASTDLAQLYLPATVGASGVFDWDWDANPLIIPASASILIWNVGSGTCADVTVNVEMWGIARLTNQLFRTPNKAGYP